MTGPAEDKVAEQKRELFRLLLQERGLDEVATRSQPVAARTDGAELELAPAQQRFWFLDRLEPDSGTYNLCGSLHCQGKLDVDALRRSIQDLLRRNEILRTTYRRKPDGSPTPVVLPEQVVELSVSEAFSAGEQQEIDTFIRDWGRLPFDLEHDLPIRTRLLRLAEEEHLLVIVVHHIAFDDDSWGLVMAELVAGYVNFAEGRPPSPSPELQFADYAAWRHRAQEEQREDQDLEYWRARLTPAPPALPLPTDFARAPVPASDGIRHSRSRPPDISVALRDLAKRLGVTLNMLMLAVVKTLLHRYSGSVDVTVGTPVVHRDRTEFEGLIGNFGNTVVLRTDLAGDPRFHELVDRVRTVCAEGYAHQGLPFEMLVESLRPSREPGRSAFSDVMFSFVANPPARFSLPDLVFTERPAYNGTARFDLVFEVMDTADGLVFTIRARSDLFAPTTVDRMLGHLITLAEAVAERPECKLSELPLLTVDERRRALREWSGTRVAPHEDRPLPAMFEDQVRRTPDADAVVFAGDRVSYAELNRRANRLARYLRELGVGPEKTVGVHLERSVEMVVGLLAILKAGGAFVPLEPAWPAHRISMVAKGAALHAVLSRPGSGRELPALDLPVISLDSEETAFAEYSGEDLDSVLGMENAAYVIFTSGSTGEPKGAVIRHQSICDRLPWQVGLLGLTEADVVLHKAPLGFDISVNEILLPLVGGARLVIAEPDTEGDVPALLTLIAEQGVTFIYVVASMLEIMLEHPGMPAASSALRHVWCGGEALTPGLYARFRERTNAVMYHGYGPAETTIGVSCRVFAEDEHGATISIGTPNPNSRLYLLDARLNPVPVGVPGELYIGGSPLARGYVNDPARTAERFHPDPFGGEPGARLYRTGDLGRYRPDGLIEFLGRADNQIKLRGRRIELAEIEAVMQEHPKIRQSVVMVRDDHLAAYGLADAADPPDSAELRDWLGARLPEYMIPRTCVALAELPLTTAGKVDRKALAELRPAGEAAAPPYLAPRGRLEHDIAAIWRRVLSVDRVGARDNFFDLGGHSLSLAKVQALCPSVLGREVSIRDLYTHTTVASLAKMLSDRETGADTARARGTDDAERRRKAVARRGELARRAALARRPGHG